MKRKTKTDRLIADIMAKAKADIRIEEIERHRKPMSFRTIIRKSKKAYSRKTKHKNSDK